MKNLNKFNQINFPKIVFIVILFWIASNASYAQDAPTGTQKTKAKQVKNTFDGSLLIDNQSVMIPVKNTLEFSIQHRFGVINNGYTDLYGLYAPANIRIGFTYVPFNDVQVGFGLCKERMIWDGNLKVAILKQTENWMIPVSVTYYGNFAVDTRDASNFVTNTDRLTYFNQLIIASQIIEDLSLQVAPSFSYFNNVEGYFNPDKSISPKMNNSHFAIAFSGRYKVTEKIGVVVNYDQPLSQHPMNNPHPNISFGVEYATAGHSFQVFTGNYQSIIPQNNNFYNQNDYLTSRYLIGFNITRKFHF